MTTNINILAFQRIKNLYNLDYDEACDILYHYMLTYLNGPEADNYMFLMEAKAVLGVKDHDDIIDYILNMY